MADKMNSYSKYVKEMYWPTVDEEKRESLKENLRPNRMNAAPIRSDSLLREDQEHFMK